MSERNSKAGTKVFFSPPFVNHAQNRTSKFWQCFNLATTFKMEALIYPLGSCFVGEAYHGNHGSRNHTTAVGK